MLQMSYIKRDKKWLLIATVIFFPIGFILNYLDGGSADLVRLATANQADPYLLFISILVAPLVEEISYRGHFTKVIWLRITSYIGLIVMVVLTKNYYLLPIFLIYILTHCVAVNKVGDLFLAVSVIFFALMHYKFNDLAKAATYGPIIFKMGIAFFLLWTVLNYSIIHAIILHIVINLCVYFAIYAPYELKPKIHTVIATKNYKIEVKQVSFFARSQTIETDGKTFLKAKHCDMNIISNLVCSQHPALIIGKYDIVIDRKENSNAAISCDEMEALRGCLHEFIIE